MSEDPVKVTYEEPKIGTPDASVNLEEIFGNLPMVTATPTWVPKRFRDGLACNTNTGTFYYYDFTNNAWKKMRATSRSSISVATASSYTLDTDSYDALSITALAGTINTISASGTPSNFDSLIIRIKDNGTSQTVAWDATKFVSQGITLPTATVVGKTMTIGFLYNSVSSVWGAVAYVHD